MTQLEKMQANIKAMEEFDKSFKAILAETIREFGHYTDTNFVTENDNKAVKAFKSQCTKRYIAIIERCIRDLKELTKSK